MANANVYERLDSALPSGKRNWSELAQIGFLSAVIVVFFAIAASSGVGLLMSALHR